MLDSRARGTFDVHMPDVPALASDAWPVLAIPGDVEAHDSDDDSDSPIVEIVRVLLRPLCRCAQQYVGTLLWVDDEEVAYASSVSVGLMLVG